jgi:uncharacterized membrane protein YfcA
MSPAEIALGVGVGLAAGILSGVFGVGGGIVMTPGIHVLLGAQPIVALATPLPVIVPTALTGVVAYRRAGEIDLRAAGWIVVAGLPASAVGALLTRVIETHLLLVVTAGLLGWQAAALLRARSRPLAPALGSNPAWRFLVVGAAAGLVSGLLGIGGGLVMVPALAGWLRLPLKRALGTSLAAIVPLVIPGAAVHAALDHVDWAIFAAVVVGAVPGASVGARIALGSRERTLRLAVGTFLLLVALGYGALEIAALLG